MRHIQARDIYPKLKKYLHKEHTNETWEQLLTAIFGLWVHTYLSTDNTLYGSSRATEKK